MKLGTGNRRQSLMAGVLGVFALGACIYLYEELFADSTPSPDASAPVAAAPTPAASAGNPVPTGNTTPANAAKPLGTTSAALDPTLHMDAMLVTESVEYSGNGRNIFSANSAPLVAIPNPLTAARPNAAQATVVVPCPPNCPPPPPPPPPPPIDLKFFGIVEATANGARQAFLLHQDSVFLASPGDVVLRRYRVVSIEAKSIRVEDMQNNNTQTLPLLTN
jgi:hypothetical protein